MGKMLQIMLISQNLVQMDLIMNCNKKNEYG
jgi:hypothetical protein